MKAINPLDKRDGLIAARASTEERLRAATDVDEAKCGLAEGFRVTQEDGSSLLANTIEVK